MAGESNLDCTQVIDLDTFQTATGETEPLTIADVAKTETDAAAICSLVNGGKKLDKTAQEALNRRTAGSA